MSGNLNDGGKNKRETEIKKNKLFVFVMWVRIRWLCHTHWDDLCSDLECALTPFPGERKTHQVPRESSHFLWIWHSPMCQWSGHWKWTSSSRDRRLLFLIFFFLKNFESAQRNKTTNRCVKSSYDAHHQRQVEIIRKELFKQMTSWPTRHDATVGGGGDDYDVLCVIQSIH